MQVKEEGWYLVVGDASTHELLALKRLSVERRSTVRVDVPAMNGAGRRAAEVRLYIMSDSYIGLDQQYDVQLPVTAAAAAKAAPPPPSTSPPLPPPLTPEAMQREVLGEDHTAELLL